MYVLAVAVAMIAMTSCKRDYTCECDLGAFGTYSDTKEFSKKSDAEDWCYADDGEQFCELK